MKPFKKIHNLQLEQERLQKRKNELETIIKADWNSLKDSLQAGNVWLQIQDGLCSNKKQAGNTIPGSLLNSFAKAIMNILTRK